MKLKGIDLTMHKYGLIGFPLSHSFSKRYFTQKFIYEGVENASYGLFPLKDEREVGRFLTNKNFSGINVTIPYKATVIPFLDELSEEAQAIQAVNVINNVDGKLIGYNTDCIGFEIALIKWLGPGLPVKNALILGTGGSAKSIAYALEKNNIPFLNVSRSASKGDLSYEQLNASHIEQADLIINCTPVGMWPNVHNAPPIPYDLLNSQHRLFDLVYNPEKTLFLTLGEERGCSIRNGMKMLVEQAEEAWRIWNNFEND
jgi:shikimate dehydrogenase